ncbi:MAG TPA: 3-hydroxyacyl-CoA dehydrogenase family protein [Acidimicrobiia bacterium]|nr:3-hydroxyacyl-CoA dehydrogenase family protein [Acidimicrobiia bacterium]
MTDSVSSTYVGILGYGTMGAGIAQVAAAAGCGVFVVDVGEEALVRGAGLLSQSLHKAVAHGKLADDAVETILGRVESGTDPRALGHCHLVIEAVTELYDVKAAALKEISRCVDGEAIIATNTSSLSVTALAANVSNPGRFAGLHFFNPAPVMRLVEIIPGIDTAAGTVGRLRAWATEVGKEPVVVKDQPGFLVNAVLMPYLNQAVRELDAGLASAEDIDIAVRLGLGYPKGPLELLDLIGLDTHLHATTSAYEETADARFAAPPMLRRLVAAGRLGKKVGSGLRTEKVHE